MSKFIEGFLTSIILALMYLTVIGLYIGGLALVAVQIISRVDLYWWVEVLILVGYTVIFIGVLNGFANIFREDDAYVATGEEVKE